MKKQYTLRSRKESEQIENNLISQLYDENLMSKYGTSISVNMGRQYSRYLDSRYYELVAEFNRIDKNSDNHINFEELLSFVKSYERTTKRTYSEEYVEKIYRLIDVDNDLAITVKEFVLAYMIIEEKLRLKKIKLLKLSEDININREKYILGQQENVNEKTNSEGISNSSSFTMTLIEVDDIDPMDYSGKADVFVNFQFQDKNESSSLKRATLHPVWYEDFQFPVETFASTVKLEVLHKSTFGGDELIGYYVLNISDFKHQKNVDRWYHLIDKEEKQIKTKIRINCRLLWSKYGFYTDNLRISNNQLEEISRDIESVDQYIELINKPYGLIIFGNLDEMIDNDVIYKGEEIEDYTAKERKSIVNTIPIGNASKVETLADKIERRLQGTLSNLH